MINVRVDTSDIRAYLSSIEKDNQAGFTISLALNRLANLAQKAERENDLAKNFKIRRKQFIMNKVYISKVDRATKSSWSVIIQIKEDYPQISLFETGADKVPFHSQYLAVPNKAVFGNRIIQSDNELAIRNLHLKNIGNRVEGDMETFLIHSKRTGTPLIIQDCFANGEKKKKMRGMNKHLGNRILYTFIKRAKMPVKLHFVQTVANSVQQNYDEVFAAAIAQALKSAKR